ncbi:hypothetical protein D6825_00850 [Candidatus Woesearchaeota archaeon]|nr:MAG: hypothetical protein D6825_00850 [Candidatus Woesearchaeota archaeon]
MYVKILNGEGRFPRLDRFEVVLHEGVFKNKRFNIPAALILKLIWGKKIAVSKSDLQEALKECAVGNIYEKDPGAKKFAMALRKLVD